MSLATLTHKFTLILATLIATISVACATEVPEIDLIAEAKATGTWNDDKTAAAVSIPSENRTGVYVLLVQANGEHTTTDISRIEDGLFAKLGTADRAEYEMYETAPIEWMTLEDGNLLLMVRLRAWRDGQRYTVAGPVIIRPDGSVLWQ